MYWTKTVRTHLRNCTFSLFFFFLLKRLHALWIALNLQMSVKIVCTFKIGCVEIIVRWNCKLIYSALYMSCLPALCHLNEWVYIQGAWPYYCIQGNICSVIFSPLSRWMSAGGCKTERIQISHYRSFIQLCLGELKTMRNFASEKGENNPVSGIW